MWKIPACAWYTKIVRCRDGVSVPYSSFIFIHWLTYNIALSIVRILRFISIFKYSRSYLLCTSSSQRYLSGIIKALDLCVFLNRAIYPTRLLNYGCFLEAIISFNCQISSLLKFSCTDFFAKPIPACTICIHNSESSLIPELLWD